MHCSPVAGPAGRGAAHGAILNLRGNISLFFFFFFLLNFLFLNVLRVELWSSDATAGYIVFII